ncbi:MAG: hypothetical protein A2521_01815 [Deltaproteobacteria bacterium RIFOXYD12_FULL_57_12]|nr:MAG: hypothetical protein A2521_01815 [Deltaproteobacteria bacterium RIFOXYD12_FULL_57_12]
MNKRLLCLICLCVSLFFLNSVTSILAAGEEPVAIPPLTLKKLKETGLNIVLVPEKNIFEQRKQYKYLTDYLAKKLGVAVHLDIMPNYGKISDAFIEGQADAGFFGSFSYVLTQAKAGIEPIARPVWSNGKSTYCGYLFVRKDSGILSVADMKGKSLALVDKATTAGYIFQRFYFNSFGINDLSEYFSHIYFAGTHDAAAWAVYIGEADVGAAKDLIFNELGDNYPDFKDKMLVLAESPPVPSNGLAVNRNMHPALKTFLKTIFLNMDKTEEGREVLKRFGAAKFIATKDEDYTPVIKMVEKLNIELGTYPYKGQ